METASFSRGSFASRGFASTLPRHVRQVRCGAGLIGLMALALTSTGCGAATPSSAFAWLRPQAPPARWPVARIATGAAIPYPNGWRRFPGDTGSATAVLQDSRGHLLGYLNLTPRQGGETLGNWASFRVHHNTADGNRTVKALDAAKGLRFRTGHGSCVRDAYTTSTGAHFIELACVVRGSEATSVIVGAAPTSAWPAMSSTIERAIVAFTT